MTNEFNVERAKAGADGLGSDMPTIAECKWVETTSLRSDVLYTCKMGDVERITVFDREIGFSFESRDIETGYRDPQGRFWLASGNFDIRDYPDLTVDEAIAKIKAKANGCVGE